MINYPEEKFLSKDELLNFINGMRATSAPSLNPKGNNIVFKTAEGNISALTYNWENERTLPVFINIHGGGFSLGHASDDDIFMYKIAKNIAIKIISVDYSLAPEAPFPKALNECYEVIKYVYDNYASLNIDRDNIFVGGHSAGGNLAAAISILSNRKKDFKIKSLILDYPPLDIATDSYLKKQLKEAIPNEVSRIFNQAYCTLDERRNPLVSPLLASDEDLKNFPKTLIITAGLDSLCDEGEKFYKRLKALNIDVTYKNFPNSVHGFTHTKDPQAKEAWNFMMDFLENK